MYYNNIATEKKFNKKLFGNILYANPTGAFCDINFFTTIYFFI